MADLSALKDKLERSFYDQGVLRTATIVSYGLRPFVRLEAEDGLLSRWGNEEQRTAVRKGQDAAKLNEYTTFASNEINKFLSAARANLSGEQWQLKTKDGPGLLTVTSVNGLLVLFRHYVRLMGLGTFEQYQGDLKKIGTFDFAGFGSSRYFAMGTALYKHLFGSDPTALTK